MNIHKKIEYLYIILASVFIASLVSCNLIFQKFFQIEIWLPFIGNYTFEQSVGLLPYPITFLVTDIISEIYGRNKANRVVTTGLISSLFMLLIVTMADLIPMAPWSPVDSSTFNKVFGLSAAAVFASMLAYLVAQYIDIRVFHFWKNLTNGKHLWLRNNASTVFSQLIDTTLVICVLFIGVWPSNQIFQAVIDGWTFKMLCALIDTPIFYACSYYFKDKFGLKLNEEISL